MTLIERKERFAKWLSQQSDENLVARLEAVREEFEGSPEGYPWDATLENDIRISQQQISEGNTVAHDDVMGDINQRFGIS